MGRKKEKLSSFAPRHFHLLQSIKGTLLNFRKICCYISFEKTIPCYYEVVLGSSYYLRQNLQGQAIALNLRTKTVIVATLTNLVHIMILAPGPAWDPLSGICRNLLRIPNDSRRKL